MDLIFILPVLILILLALYLLFQGAIYVPSNEKAINAIIKMAKLKKGGKIADLGSGDGRIVIAFARSGIQAHGFEINPFLVLFSRWNIKKEKLTDRASIHWQDFWKINFNPYNAVVVFGIDYMMGRLEKKLRSEMRPGSKILLNIFPFPKWPYSQKKHGVYLYKT